MKKIIAFILGIFMVFSLSACGGGSSNKNKGGKSCGYKYPTSLLGGHAVWRAEKENKTCRELEIRNGDRFVTARVYLDLHSVGLSVLNDYFNLIVANGYV